MSEKLSMKRLKGQTRLNDEKYAYFLKHGITIEEFLLQKNEERKKEF